MLAIVGGRIDDGGSTSNVATEAAIALEWFALGRGCRGSALSLYISISTSMWSELASTKQA